MQGRLDPSILNCPGVELARRNLEAALLLLKALMEQGLSKAVLCPGSRSGALALALGVLEPRGLALYTAIDERSAAFLPWDWPGPLAKQWRLSPPRAPQWQTSCPPRWKLTMAPFPYC